MTERQGKPEQERRMKNRRTTPRRTHRVFIRLPMPLMFRFGLVRVFGRVLGLEETPIKILDKRFHQSSMR